MYCPICFNDTLELKRSGIVHLIINGQQMDAGRFLFNQDSNRPDETLRDFSTKIEEFFKWYSSFQNQLPIAEVFISSSDYECRTGCKVPLSNKFSIVDILIPRNEVNAVLARMAEKYSLKIELKDVI